ncbi:MAG: aspartate carbamoyltransferase catalytic subunit [Alphaproteobacteria bacterium]|nr:aspartate carbamoyltransferase catalytic subunit [Alphaproteobacteria bacterium]
MPLDPEEKLGEVRAGRDAGFFDLHSADQISLVDLSLIFDLARAFRETKTEKLSLCKGCSVVHAFFEPSTRTLSSFDLSAKNLSMDTNAVSSGSSVKKGESFLDTAQTLDSYNLAVITVRSSEAGVPEFLARHTRAAVINAGDGWHEHPSQGLLDILTMLDRFGTADLSGRTVTIVGDILHSRVFGSLIRLLRKLDATVRVAAPYTFMPAEAEKFGLTHYTNVEEALDGADVVYALRVQEERGAGGFIPTLREYSKMYGISRKRLDIAGPDAILMHPGPVRRDVDVHSALSAVDPQSFILRQVENGMAVRKALLWLLSKRMDERDKEYTRL